MHMHITDYYKKGKAYGLKALKMFEETVLKEMKNIGSDIAGDIGGEIGSITSYSTGDINGLLDKVNKTKVKWHMPPPTLLFSAVLHSI